MTKKKPCKHKNLVAGARIPLVYGSAETQVCGNCGMWRQVRAPNLWHPISEYYEAINNADEESYQ